MEYRIIGNTDLSVSRLSLSLLSGYPGSVCPLSGETIKSIVHYAIESGINAIDMRDVDAFGREEEILGRLLKNDRPGLVLSARIGSRIAQSSPEPGFSYIHLINAVETALRGLGTDYLDLLFIHLDNVFTRMDENVRALDNLVERGLVRFAGFYNFSAWRAAEEFRKPGKPGNGRFEAAQMYYSILDRDLEYDVALSLLDEGIGLVTRSRPGNDCSPVGREYPADRTFDAETCRDIYYGLCSVAALHGGVSPDTVALAWLLSRPIVTTAILEVRSTEILEENLRVLSMRLERDEIEYLDTLTEPKTLLGHSLHSRERMPAYNHS